MGHCDQRSYRFLKLTPLSHVSLVTRRSSPVVVTFKMCMASWSGWVRTALSEFSFISNLLCGAFRRSLIIQEMKIAEKKSKSTKLSVQQTTEASSRQNAQPISVEFIRSCAMHCWWNNGFPRSKNKNNRLAIYKQTDETCLRTESRTYQPFS